MDKLLELQNTVVKNGVSLGCLAESLRADVLALAWAAMPADELSEREVNEVLRAALDGAMGFLATDHVELRRWLVDSRWLRRDSFGRVYQRTAPTALSEEQQDRALPLLRVADVTAWVAGLRAAKTAARESQRQAWNARAQGLST
jgi:hypothetical protein